MIMGGFSDHRGYLDLLPWVVNENTGLIILLLLALTSFYAGIHLGWRLFIVGIFLGLALIGATYLEEFVWISKKCNFFLFSIF